MADSDWKRSLKDCIGGTVGGIVQVLSGQPFDIVKVRLASSQGNVGALQMAVQITKTEGALSFWKGSLPPLAGVGACVSIQFGVLEYAKRAFMNYNNSKEVSTIQGCMAGSLAGIANTIVSAPAEHLRIKMQVQGKVDPRGDPFYKSSGDCARKIYAEFGIRGIYRAFLITTLREACTFATYFGTYEYLVNKFKPEGGRVEDVPAWKLLIAGGLAGYAYWAPWYPIDAVKSKLQADSFANPRYKNSFDCIRQTFAKEGVSGFYRGFLPCMLRAFPVNACTFLAFEFTMRTIGRD